MNLHTRILIENCVTLVVTAGAILGLYALGAGGWSAFGALFFLNIQYVKVRTP